MVLKKIYTLLLTFCIFTASLSIQAMQELDPTGIKSQRFTHHQDEKRFVKKVQDYMYISCQTIPKAIFDNNPALKEIEDLSGSVEKTVLRAEHQIISTHMHNEIRHFLDKLSSVMRKIDSMNNHHGDQLRIGLLLRATVFISTHSRVLVLHLLDAIDKHIVYWENQLIHPIHYFFHKSPSKWFAVQSQREEIKKRLKNLKLLTSHLYSTLGLLTAHMSDYNPQNTIENQYKWLSDFVMIIKSLYDSTILINDSTIKPEDMLKELCDAFSCTNKYRKNINKRIIQLGRPHHIERNWLWYSAGFLGSVCASVFLWRNHDKIPQWISTTRKTIWKQVIYTPFKAFKDAFWPDKVKEDKNYFTQNMQLERDRINKIIGSSPSLTTNAVKTLFTTTMNKCKENGCLSHNVTQINQGADDLINPGNGNGQSVQMIDEAMLNVSNKLSQLAGTRGGLFRVGLNGDSTLVALVIPLANLSIQAYKIKGNALIEPGQNLLNVLITRADTLLHSAERILTQNKATAALAAVVPATLAVWGGYAGISAAYRYLKGKKQYISIQSALIEIAHILNFYNDNDAYPTDMGPEDYGKLVYLIHKLKTEAYQVPEQHRTAYLNDVKKLTSGSITAKKKMKVVDLMYKSYDFLTPKTHS